jgi:hypothetical protein
MVGPIWMSECSHFNWTILGSEGLALADSMVRCRDCGRDLSLKVAMVTMNVRLIQLEKLNARRDDPSNAGSDRAALDPPAEAV